MTLPRFQTFISLPSLLTGVLSRRSGMAVVDSRTMRQFSLHDSYTLPNLHLLAVAPYGGSEPSLWLAVVDSRTMRQFSLHDSSTLPNLHLLAVAPYGGSEPSLWHGCDM
ncbi:hypothetical protein DFJ58DRAFT_737580 [Suillus subalutaceus]|uniref:uncharacterized protein n=1 Tax=Suillus subalutaceus TaxID=48586 RepID=UPI001B86A387|nr:uncharacterized protein DFJ58DRAFT_738156 [Suillus subalutaceus]XP_041235061.1 uncharacterized protein DFJ58DRAFT_737580 [Suillus subalutaceus]KAG1827850.1 hypothetical protein DFJ58DRAFT_738156 [Suillus subalutaceus]KAG1828888.1 hypothetical protein DFJ58DRAFT_737580 [Suillus subalutaceus]